MNKLFFRRALTLVSFFAFCGILTVTITSFNVSKSDQNSGILKINFTNTAAGKTINLRDSLYVNAFGEPYRINKLKYYISNIHLSNQHEIIEKNIYFLVNAASENNSIEISLKPGIYHEFSFLLGVDSLHNCSGAQNGALDPMNDMFWTWNSGYVVFKLEGESPASSADLQRIEHHIGGYKALNNVSKTIRFRLKDAEKIKITQESITELNIEMNLDHYWQGKSNIKINESPLCTSSGKLANQIALNFENLFTIKNFSNGH